jgi:hypothetical protein
MLLTKMFGRCVKMTMGSELGGKLQAVKATIRGRAENALVAGKQDAPLSTTEPRWRGT